MRANRADLSPAPEDIAAVNNRKSAGIPVVVILFSGRPLIYADVMQEAGDLVAAWLPGTKGDRIAGVMLGAPQSHRRPGPTRLRADILRKE